MTETSYNKPLPLLEGLTKEFYDWCAKGELRFQRCQDCGSCRELADLLGMVQDAVIVERVLAGRPGELTEYALDEQRRRSQAAEKRVADARKSATASTADSGRLATAPAQPPV